MFVYKMQDKIGYCRRLETLRCTHQDSNITNDTTSKKCSLRRSDIVAWRSRYFRKLRENDLLGKN